MAVKIEDDGFIEIGRLFLIAPDDANFAVALGDERLVTFYCDPEVAQRIKKLSGWPAEVVPRPKKFEIVEVP